MKKLSIAIELCNNAQFKEMLDENLVTIRVNDNDTLVDTFVLNVSDLVDIDFMNNNISEVEMYEVMKNLRKQQVLQ